MASATNSCPTIKGVAPNGPSSSFLVFPLLTSLLASSLEYANPSGLRRSDAKSPPSDDNSLGLSFRATTKHSAIPVSAENDRSSFCSASYAKYSQVCIVRV